MHYKKEKRKDIDLCNICGKSKRLTWDHVPPKCCNNRYAIKTNSWMEGIPEESSYTKKYQNVILDLSIFYDSYNARHMCLSKS